MSDSTRQRSKAPWAIVIWVFVIALLSISVVGVLMLTHVFAFGLDSGIANELGAELIGGGVIGLALLGAEIGFGFQLQRLETERERMMETDRQAREQHAERESLRLQLGTSNEFPGIDLQDKDLSGFYLPGRNLSHANLQNANLAGANLKGVNLVGAKLFSANLKGAILSDADMSGSELYDANLHDADIQNANLINATSLNADRLQGAMYTEATQWPDGYIPSGEQCNDHPPGEPDHWHHH